jgi:hypothetical protein
MQVVKVYPSTHSRPGATLSRTGVKGQLQQNNYSRWGIYINP